MQTVIDAITTPCAPSFVMSPKYIPACSNHACKQWARSRIYHASTWRLGNMRVIPDFTANLS